MPKRKRENGTEQAFAGIDDQALRIKVSRLKARFDNGVLQLTAQLKLARAFDRQKMTRRIKQANGDDKKLERLQAEVQVLKQLSEAKAAKDYLLKQCVRTKRIAEAEAFQELLRHGVLANLASSSVVEGNVFGRLFKSNPVGEVLPSIMKGIREVLDVDNPVVSTQSRNTKDQKTNYMQSNSSVSSEDPFEGFSDQEPVTTIVNSITTQKPGPYGEFVSDAESSDDELMDAYGSRLATTSDEDEYEDALDDQSHDRLEIDDMQTGTNDDVSSDALDDAVSTPPEVYLDSQSRKGPPGKQTSFLPSLMMGGYYSGSDSEGGQDGYDPDKANAAVAKPRNNRRGQRERQKIAELKFGARAKHLLKANGAEGVHGDRQKLISGSRDQGWDAKRGAVDSSSRGRESRRVDRGHSRFERRHEPAGRGKGAVNSQAANSRKETSTANLHPSWEAAKKRKAETSRVGENAFAGKKITFD